MSEYIVDCRDARQLFGLSDGVPLCAHLTFAGVFLET